MTTAVSSDGPGGANALVIQPDGKLVAAGDSSSNLPNYDFTLVRYNANGSLDRSFGRGGKVTTPIGPQDAHAYALVIQPDGKLVAAGDSSYRFALARYRK